MRPRLLTCLLLLALSATAPAAARDLTGTITAMAEGSLPAHCVLARIESTTPLELSPRDVCTIRRGSTTLGSAVVLTAADDVAVLYVLFGRPLHQGDRVQVAERQGYVMEDAFLMRLADFYSTVGTLTEAAAIKPLWNGLHYRSESDFAPHVLHMWAASLEGGVVRGVDEEGLWRKLPVIAPDVCFVHAAHATRPLRKMPRGLEMDLVLGEVDGRQVIVAGVAHPPLRLEQLLPRLLPRVPLDFASPVVVPQTRVEPRPAATLRLLRGCRLASVDALQGLATLRTFNGELVRVRFPDPLRDLAGGARVDPETLVSRDAFDVVCYSDGRQTLVLGLGEPRAAQRETPAVVGEVQRALGADFYELVITCPKGLRPRDVVTVWRDGARLGRGVVFSRNDRPLLFARAGTPVLHKGDRVTFERRAAGAYVDGDGFTDLAQCKGVRQTSDPRRWFDTRGYGSDLPPTVPDLYKGGPYATVRPEVPKKGDVHP